MNNVKWSRVAGLLLVVMALSGLFAQTSGQEKKKQGQKSKIEFIIPPEGKVQILRTRDGSELIGRIVKIGRKNILFESDLGRTEIRKASVRSLTMVDADKVRGGEVWFENPNATRMFFAPTARTLKSGNGYFADVYLFFPSVAYGLTDNITIGGGISLFPNVPFDEQLLYLTPKVGFSIGESAHGAVGVLLLRMPDFSDSADNPLGVGILYGVTTFGSMDKSITAGLGYGFVDKEVADRPMVILGGEWRVSRRVSLVTENWVLPGLDGGLVSYGVRFFGRKLSVDLAFWSPTEEFLFPGIPYVDFVYTF
ncbi:MAG TPA: hypothetical protein ENJ29_15310 [Bacteroidetes bacterium]|nr:hypothetical protein [Bacteroidota bacterium]